MYFLVNYKSINKLGMVNLPKKWRAALGFQDGERVEIRMLRNEIWIFHGTNENYENQRFISSRGMVNIPAEFRRILEIDTDTGLCMYAEVTQNAFIIKPYS